MPVVDYTAFEVNLTDLDACLGFVAESIAAWGLTLPLDADLQLTVTAGTDAAGTTVYRPYGYQADVLERSRNTIHLRSGAAGPVNGEFMNPEKTIAAWRAIQVRTDGGLGLRLPDAFTSSRPLVSRLVF